MPAISGVEKEVPLLCMVLPQGAPTHVPQPTAQPSGLTRPSAVGPFEENGALLPLGATAPTVKTWNPSEGNPTNFHFPAPWLPALVQSSIPFDAAIAATLLTRALLPSVWA